MTTFPKLTKQDRCKILKACELIELGHQLYCCWALRDPQLAAKFSRFYDKDGVDNWFEESVYVNPRTQERILLLLWFMEVCS